MNGYILALYPISFFIIISLVKHKKQNSCFIITLLLYLCSGITSMVLYYIQPFKSPVYFSAVLYHILMMLLLIMPLRHYDKYARIPLCKISSKSLFPIVCILIIISLIAILQSARNIDFRRIATDVVGIRQDMVEGVYNSGGVIGYISYYARKFWGVSLILCFYYLTFYPNKKLIILLLFISSLSEVVDSLTIAGRDIVLKYIFVSLLVFLLFRYKLNPDIRKKVSVFFSVVASVFVMFFLLVSILRWDMNTTADQSTISAMISYFGQPFLFFSEYFHEFAHKGVSGGAIHFPLFAGHSLSRFELDNLVNTTMTLNTFSTCVGSWIFEVGAVMTFVITLIHNIIFVNLKRKRCTIFTLIYILWVFEFIFISLFYYIYTINLSFLLSIILVKIWEIIVSKF